MSDFEKILWGALFAAGSIVIGWILTQIGLWWRSKHEDKKNLKLVLFHLLETYVLILRCDFDQYTQIIRTKVVSKIPKKDLPEDIESFNRSIDQSYSSVFTKVVQPQLEFELEANQKKYLEAIHTLASIDPIMAYYLNTQKNIFQIFQMIDEGIGKVESNLLDIETEKESQAVLNHLKSDLLNEFIKDLEQDLKKLAWKINPIMWLKIKRTIKRMKKNTTDGIEQLIDELFKRAEPVLN